MADNPLNERSKWKIGGRKPPVGKNFLLNVATFSRDTIYRALGAMIARGPNGVIMLDSGDRMIDELARLDRESTEKRVDVYIANSVKELELDGVTFSNHTQAEKNPSKALQR